MSLDCVCPSDDKRDEGHRAATHAVLAHHPAPGRAAAHHLKESRMPDTYDLAAEAEIDRAQPLLATRMELAVSGYGARGPIYRGDPRPRGVARGLPARADRQGITGASRSGARTVRRLMYNSISRREVGSRSSRPRLRACVLPNGRLPVECRFSPKRQPQGGDFGPAGRVRYPGADVGSAAAGWATLDPKGRTKPLDRTRPTRRSRSAKPG